MKMRTQVLLSAMALIVGVALSVSANEGKEYWTKLKAELGLNDSQVTQLQQKMEALHPEGEQAERRAKALHEKIEAAERAGDQKTVEAKKSELESLTGEWKERVNAIYQSVLTKQQFAKFEGMRVRREGGEREEKERREKQEKQR